MAWNFYDESNNLIGSFQGMEDSDYTEYSASFCVEPGCYFIEALDLGRWLEWRRNHIIFRK